MKKVSLKKMFIDFGPAIPTFSQVIRLFEYYYIIIFASFYAFLEVDCLYY